MNQHRSALLALAVALAVAVTAACQKVEQPPAVGGEPVPANWAMNAKDKVAATLREPKETRFRKVVLVAEKHEGTTFYTACGEFSAYAYGERAEYKPFLVLIVSDKTVVYIDNATAENIKMTCAAPVVAKDG